MKPPSSRVVVARGNPHPRATKSCVSGRSVLRRRDSACEKHYAVKLKGTVAVKQGVCHKQPWHTPCTPATHPAPFFRKVLWPQASGVPHETVARLPHLGHTFGNIVIKTACGSVVASSAGAKRYERRNTFGQKDAPLSHDL